MRQRSLEKERGTLEPVAATYWGSLYLGVFCQALSVGKDGWLNTKSAMAGILFD